MCGPAGAAHGRVGVKIMETVDRLHRPTALMIQEVNERYRYPIGMCSEGADRTVHDKGLGVFHLPVRHGAIADR